MTGKSWYSTGFSKDSGGGKSDMLTWEPDRVWMPAKESRDFVFVDDAPFTFDEHNLKLNGNWKNWITCLAPVTEDGEPNCCQIAGKDSRYRVSMMTIVDTSKWTDKKGNARQYEIKVLPAKFKTSQKLDRKMTDLAKDGKSIVGRLYRVTRETDKSPAVGDDYEYTRDVDMTKLFDLVVYKGKKLADLYTAADESAEAYAKLSRVFAISKGADGKIVRKLVPFRYDAIYAPKTAKEVKELLGGFDASENTRDYDNKGSSGGSTAAVDDEIPF
jgi:hypothetical protein